MEESPLIPILKRRDKALQVFFDTMEKLNRVVVDLGLEVEKSMTKIEELEAQKKGETSRIELANIEINHVKSVIGKIEGILK